MLEKNRAASLGFYDAGVHVTADILFGALGVSISEVRFHICAQRGLGRTHRNHVVEPIATMDVHVMGYWAQSVRRIQIAIALDMREPAPQAFPFTRSQNTAQVVEISPLSMRDFAEESITHHAQDHHLSRAITAVLQDDAMLASSLRRIDEVPALLQCCTGRHFNGSMFAILHNAERHRNVPVPWGRYIDDVKVGLGQVLEIPFVLAEPCGLRLACVCAPLLRARHFLPPLTAYR